MSNSQPNLIEARRERVAALTLRGFTAREIVAALGHGENALLNPKTGRPYSIGSIARDLMALKRRWLEASQENYAAAKARHLAEIGALKRAAWAAGDLAALARALDREARVWGFDAPGKHELTGAEGERLIPEPTSAAELVRELNRLFDAARAREARATDRAESLPTLE